MKSKTSTEENKEILRDDFLTGLMNRSSWESPSDDFTIRVMQQIGNLPAYEPQKKPFFLFLKSVLPWVLLVAVFVSFYLFYDLPFGRYIPGREFVQDILVPSFSNFFVSFRDLASGKFYSIAFVILISAGGLFVIERMVSQRTFFKRHYLV